MKVELKEHTPNPMELIAFAARTCYSKDPSQCKKTPQEYIEMLMNSGHESPIEHVSYTFFIEGISRACSHQLVRHRISSVSQRSQRYISESSFEYIIPKSLAGKSVILPDVINTVKAEDYFIETMEILQERYAVLQTALGGAKESSNEDARYVLPNACQTTLVLTMNVRSLCHFFHERLCHRAQWEIRELAGKMLELVKPTAPELWEHAGPKCKLFGYCKEHKSCGLSPRKA